MHPWWSIQKGLPQGDIGAFLYRHFHSLYHKSRNPGPWSRLSMHPVEHFFYYTCVFFLLLFTCHPLHFLYAKFNADISLIRGHDGPAGGAAFHYLHHTYFECNYGVPLLDFDRLFGTYKEYVKKPSSNNKQNSFFLYLFISNERSKSFELKFNQKIKHAIIFLTYVSEISRYGCDQHLEITHYY
jgi:hypothetical protein